MNPSDRTYPITADLEYRLMKDGQTLDHGAGETKTMSTSSVWFRSDKVLQVGILVQLAITWPALLDKMIPLKLVIFGRTVRVEGNFAQLDILRHEFRTRAIPALREQPATISSLAGRTMTVSA